MPHAESPAPCPAVHSAATRPRRSPRLALAVACSLAAALEPRCPQGCCADTACQTCRPECGL